MNKELDLSLQIKALKAQLCEKLEQVSAIQVKLEICAQSYPMPFQLNDIRLGVLAYPG